nr:sigma-70 family RNA polymerase sigma factor [Motilibacter rhizosphaerae]
MLGRGGGQAQAGLAPAPAPAAGPDQLEALLRDGYDAHGGELYGFALRRTGDHHAAEEAVQETFVRAWRAADRFDPGIATLRAWLFAILRNVLVDASRAASVRPRLALGDEPERAGPADELDRVLDTWMVEDALRRLRPDHRRILVEVHLRGRSYAEVAGELAIPEGTARSRTFYALKALRLALEEMGWTG